MELPLRIGLFGGSFDPPHTAHVLVAGWALCTGEVDRIWVIPTGGHPFYKDLTPFVDRIEMCRRAFACYGARVKATDIERQAETHYTIDTIENLRTQYPDHQWRWIMGSDTLGDAARWRDFDKVMRLAPPLIVSRGGHPQSADPQSAIPNPQSSIPFALPNLSSTWVRERLAEGRLDDLQSVVPRSVLTWIADHGLYGLSRPN